jgi:hypothetical protein
MFFVLQRNKQILIVTLLFGCSHDEDISARSSAVRALATCVLFPALREVCHIDFSIPVTSFFLYALLKFTERMHGIEILLQAGCLFHLENYSAGFN